MFKLVAIGGKYRGNEYKLEDGDNTIGRGGEADIEINIEGVSKKHFQITINADSAYLTDLKSSNGTLLNGRLIESAQLKAGDEIALPNLILKLVHIHEKVSYKKVKVTKSKGETQFDTGEEVPKSAVAKVFYNFRHKFMPIVYNFNEQYEYRYLLGIFLFLLIVFNVTLIIYPILSDSRKLLLYEISKRGEQMADDVIRNNTVNIARREDDLIDTQYLEGRDDGLIAYELYDTNLRVLRPLEKMNSITTTSFSVQSIAHFKREKTYQDPYIDFLGSGKIGITKAIIAHDVDRGRSYPVGYISLIYQPTSLMVEAARNSMAYLEALITSSLVAVLIFGILYYLTTNQLKVVNKQVEEFLINKRNEIEFPYKFEELNPLIKNVNNLFMKIRELSSTGGDDFQPMEEDYKYVQMHKGILDSVDCPAIVLNSQKIVEHINPKFEDVTGIRESSSQGLEFIEVARDQGMAAVIAELCENSGNNEGHREEGEYEIGGKEYYINATALIGGDNYPKSFFISFIEIS